MIVLMAMLSKNLQRKIILRSEYCQSGTVYTIAANTVTLLYCLCVGLSISKA